MPLNGSIEAITRFSRGFAKATVVFVSLAMFICSLMAFHKPEVIALLLLRTAGGYLQILVLLATSMLPLLCIVFMRPKENRGWNHPVKFVVAAMVSGFYLLSLSLLYYRMETGAAFDLSILRFYSGDGVRTLLVLSQEYTGILILLAVLGLYHFYGVLIILTGKSPAPGAVVLESRTPGSLRSAASIGCLAALLVSQAFADNGMRNLLQEAKRGASRARSLYVKYFDESIRRNQMEEPALLQHEPSKANLFMVQLESINAALVNPAITPNLLGLAGDGGVVFPRIQSAAVFTILSMETILCGTLPTLEKNLAQMNELHPKLRCLPRILKQQGFKTLYFQAYPKLQFHNMKSFLSAIGFDETHAEDIMQPGDPSLKWGFVEDVFYRRVFAYLEKYRNEKLFVYILAGSANHYPFFDAEMETAFPSLKERLPYQAPRNIRERMADTMFIQDHFFGEMYRKLYAGPFGNTSQMLVFGDHSWPLELHSGNNNNLKGAFQENLATAMAYLPQRQLQPPATTGKGRIVSSLYSYFDLPATVLDMYGMKQIPSSGKSFKAELEKKAAGGEYDPDRCVLSVQPFSGGEIAVINYPIKYIFDLKNDSLTTFNLATDGDERSPVRTVKIDEDQLAVLESCLRELTGREGSQQARK